MKTSARNKLILTSLELFRKQGIAGTGVSEILAKSELARGTLYKNFPDGKEQLACAATELAGEHLAKLLTLFAEQTPEQVLEICYAEIIKNLADTEYLSWCPIAVAAIAGPGHPETQKASSKVFQLWETTIANGLSANGLSQSDASSLAQFTIAATEGALMLAISHKSPAPLLASKANLLKLLESYPRNVAC